MLSASVLKTQAIALRYALVVLCAASVANAETFTVPLSPTEQTGANGPYLSAPFDFGTAFSEIRSVTLQFTMPGGYHGTAVTTGNSSVYRSLSLLLSDGATPVPDLWYNSASSLGATAFDVAAGVPHESRFVYSVSLGDAHLPLDWPDFLFTGTGKAGWTDMIITGYRPLADGVLGRSSTSWLLPGEVRSGQLTIVGVPVPESRSIVLLVSGMLFVLCWRGQRRAAVSANHGPVR